MTNTVVNGLRTGFCQAINVWNALLARTPAGSGRANGLPTRSVRSSLEFPGNLAGGVDA